MTTIYRWLLIRRGLLLLIGTSVLLAACASGGSTSTPAPPAFHRALKTTDGQYSVQVSVTPNRLGLNVFTVQVQESNGKPAPNLNVRLLTTMLDMDMGTEQVTLSPNGHGQYSAQGTLAMNGHWELLILLRASSTSSVVHRTSVELDTST